MLQVIQNIFQKAGIRADTEGLRGEFSLLTTEINLLYIRVNSCSSYRIENTMFFHYHSVSTAWGKRHFVVMFVLCGRYTDVVVFGCGGTYSNHTPNGLISTKSGHSVLVFSEDLITYSFDIYRKEHSISGRCINTIPI